MAQIPDMIFTLRPSSRGLERLNTAIMDARANLQKMQSSVAQVQEALDDLEFIVERSKPEEAIADGDQDPGS
jgi:hypothetical protein